MTQRNLQLVREFFNAISKGELPDDLVTPDMTAWTVSSGASDKQRFQGGIKLLASIFAGSLSYTIDVSTCEDDRVVAETRSHGTLTNGEDFNNTHVFLFRIRDGRIASVAEYMNQNVVRDQLVPLMQAALNESKPNS